MPSARRFPIIPVFFLLLLLYASSGHVRARQYLSGGELAAIGTGSLAVLFTGMKVREVDSSQTNLWVTPFPLEIRLHKWLGGDCSATKTNFLDSRSGSAVTPVAAAVLLFATDLYLPNGETGKDAAQDQFIYCSGLLATKGITSMAKGIVARQRPLPCLCPEEAKLRPEIDFNYDHQSFFSGHTSSAFFAMTYLNKRVRGVMRSELSHHEYNNWRWVSSAVTFGWAGFVGWSRIQSYKHFPSDVAAGALAGWLLGELFFRFGNKSVELPGESTDAAMIIRLQFPL